MRDYNATTRPATAIAAPAKEPRVIFEAAPVKGAAVPDGDRLAAGTVGAVPFPPETAPPVGPATYGVVVAKPEDPAPVALQAFS